MKRFINFLFIIFFGLVLGGCDILNSFLPSSSSTPNNSISFNTDKIEIDVNTTYELKVTFNGDFTSEALTWTVQNPTVAKVENGLVTGLKSGETTIKASAENNIEATCIVKVYNIIDSVKFNSISTFLIVNDVIELQATISPTDVKDATLIYTIDETDCASLEGNILTALKPGTVKVNVTTVNNKKDSIEITIYETVEIEFDCESPLELGIGETKQINISTSLGSIIPSFNWYSINENIATVENGLVTALSFGTTTIVANQEFEGIKIEKSIEISVVFPKIIDIDFKEDGNQNFTSNNVNFNNEDGYYKFESEGDKLLSPTFETSEYALTIELLYKVTKSSNNDEDFAFVIYGNNGENILSTITLNSSNTTFSSGDNLNTFTASFPSWNNDSKINNLQFELSKKKTGSNFWLYGVKLYHTSGSQTDPISFHFLELGNKYTGDSIYIKAGDVDILIDAGSTKSSASTITSYLNNYVTDNKLEYVIATHAHEDHIAGFVGSSTSPGIFKTFEIDTIIDYALKNTTSKISQDYEAARDELVANGTKHYTAADCINKTNGATDYFEIAEGISFTILDQIHYFEKSSDENDHSVCTLFTVGESNFLFTGDLEAGGEESLVKRNDLPHCVLYKAGHHGSKTSSNNELLSAITPEIVTVCCCAGSSEYTKDTDNMFPTQDFITRIAPYTTKVYVTTQATYTIATNNGVEYLKYEGFKSLNGNIVISYDNGNISIKCSDNDTILKDSEWFNRKITLNNVTRPMRTWPNVESMYN